MPAIALEQVHKRYRVYRQRYRSLKDLALHGRLGEWEDRWALRGIDLAVEPGTSVGLVGPNGAGKSTALKLMARILQPDRGRVVMQGRVGALIELGAGFHPEATGRENVYLNASLFGLSRRDVDRRFESIVDFSELADYIDAPLRTYSSGMQLRLGFAVAIHLDPEIMLLDEILAVGDEAFQSKCLHHIERFKAQGGTIVLVSHSMESIRRICTQAAWVQGGVLRAQGEVEGVVEAYLGDVYTAAGEREEPSGPRPEVEIGEVVFRDGAGERTRTFRTGEPMSVEIFYRRHRPLAQPVFGLTFHRADGVYVYGTNTAFDGVSTEGLPDAGSVTLHFPGLGLLRGHYRVSVAVIDGRADGRPVDFRDQRYPVQVESRVEDHGVAVLEHAWSVAR